MRPWLIGLFGVLSFGCSRAPAQAPAPPAAQAPPPESSPRVKPLYPETRREAVTQTYHAVPVTEQYRWLERASAPDVRHWTDRQNAFSSQYLSQLPGRAALSQRVQRALGFEAPSYYPIAFRAGRFFARKQTPPAQQPVLVVFDDPFSPIEQVILDPNVLDPSGLTHIDWFEPSPNGKLVAVSLSKGGTESGDVYLYDVPSGKHLGEVVPRVQAATASGDVSWTRDSKGFFYTRYPAPGERPPEDALFYQQLYYHEVGTSVAEDRYELGRGFPRIAEIRITPSPFSDHVLATVQKGDGGECAIYLRDPGGSWHSFSDFGDGLKQAAFGPRSDLYVLSLRDAPRGEVLRLSLRQLDVAKATVVVAEGPDAIIRDFWQQYSLQVTENALYVKYQTGGPSELRSFTLDGAPSTGPQKLAVSSYGAVFPLNAGRLLFSNGSFTRPWGWFLFDPKSGATQETALSSKELIDLSPVSVVREFARSKDGTRVPVNILSPPDVAQDGTAPCVVSGYGGYGVSLSPMYGHNVALLLEQGVVSVVVNLRGGGEFGEAWHRAGNLTNKQNVFDDFAAAIRHVKSQKHCAGHRIAIMGGSNGGLLMGATLVQHPELVRAVVSYVGLYDMLRSELSANGSFNITEFGTVKDPAEFAALYAYSPYHHVQDGVAYPATLLLTGANDARVDPMHTRKMTARLQAATSGAAPILLVSNANAGHGSGKKLDDRIAETTNALAFLFAHLGVAYVAK